MASSSGDAEADAQPLQEETEIKQSRPSESSRCAKINQIRRRIDEIIHDRKVEIAILVFIIIDALIVLFELLIDLKIFGEEVKEGKLPEALHIISIVILSLFMIEVFIKIFALGRKFFKSVMNVIDAVIVIISFIMDILFMNNEEWHDLIGLLIVLRLWRIVRIVNGIVQTVREQYEMDLEKKNKKIEKLETKISTLKSKLQSYGETVEDSESDDEEDGKQKTEAEEKVAFKKDEIELKITTES